MDRFDAARLARRLLAEHGLTGWTFAFNRRKRSLGLCRYGERRIELSVHLVDLNSDEEVLDTLLHEIAHALCGPKAGHGAGWRARCLELGARPERLCRRRRHAARHLASDLPRVSPRARPATAAR